MPYKKKNYVRKKRPYRRRWRRRRGYRGTALTNMNTRGPLPRTYKAKLRYTESITLNPGAGTVQTYTFNMASLYDPNYTGTGHQPLGFDQLISMYDHFCVIGSKLTATFSPSSGMAVPTTVCLNLDADVSTLGDIDNAIEQNSSKYCLLNPQSPPQTLTMSYSPKTFMGISKPLSADKLQGTASANPTDCSFVNIYCQATDGSSDPGAIDVAVTIDYVAIFHEPLTLAPS